MTGRLVMIVSSFFMKKIAPAPVNWLPNEGSVAVPSADMMGSPGVRIRPWQSSHSAAQSG